MKLTWIPPRKGFLSFSHSLEAFMKGGGDDPHRAENCSAIVGGYFAYFATINV